MLTGGNMRRFIVITLLVVCGSLVCTHLSAQEAVEDAEYTRIIKEYRLNDDGSIENHVIKELKILSHFAFHSLYGETFIIYDPRYQQLHVNEAYTVMADGKKVITPGNAFNDVLPRFAANFPDAAHLREKVITHTGLEVGATIHLDYTLTSNSGYYPALMAKEVLVTSSPVDRQIISVEIPESVELHHKMIHLRTAPEVYQENGRKRYTWTFPPLKARTQEPFQPPETEYLPTLIFSTGRNFDEVFASFVSQDAFRRDVTREMKARLAAIKQEQSDPFRQVFAIQKMVAEEFNFFDVPLEYTGYRVRTAEDTWLSNGGTEAEKNALLCALLQEAGFPASLYAVIPGELMDRSIGCLPAIKGFAVKVMAGESDNVILSAIRMDDQGLMTALNSHSLVEIDLAAFSLNADTFTADPGNVNAEFTLTIDTAFRMSGMISAHFKGILNPTMALKRDKDYAKGAWNSFASAGFIRSCTIKTSTPEESVLEWEADCPTAFKKQDEYYFLELPVLKNGSAGFQMNYLNASRTAPLKIPFPLEESYTYSLVVPSGIHMLTEDKSTSIINQAGSVSVKISGSKRTVHITRKLRLITPNISPQQYEAFRVLVNEWNDMNNRRLIFKKEK